MGGNDKSRESRRQRHTERGRVETVVGTRQTSVSWLLSLSAGHSAANTACAPSALNNISETMYLTAEASKIDR